MRVYSLLERVKAIVGGNEIRPLPSKDFSFEAAEGIDSLDLAIWNLVSRRGTRRPPRYRASSSFSGSSGSGPLASLASRANSLSCN